MTKKKKGNYVKKRNLYPDSPLPPYMHHYCVNPYMYVPCESADIQLVTNANKKGRKVGKTKSFCY